MRVSTLLTPAVLAATASLLACENPGPLASDAPPTGAVTLSAAPVTFEEPYQFDIDCGGYTVTNAGIATGHLTLLPAGGTPRRSVVHFSLRGALTNTTTGRSVPNTADFTVFADLATGATTIVGGGTHVVANGVGIVTLDAGILRFDGEGTVTFEGGRHDLAGGEADAQACELLA